MTADASALAPGPGSFLTPSELVEGSIERWKVCGNLEETTLLRLSILRDLMRKMHAEKSRCMAYGRHTLVQDFNLWEKKIEWLRSAADLSMGLEDAIERADTVRKRTRLIPEALFTFIPREKLERYDRSWEAAIAAEASSLGWCFWQLTAWVRIEAVETWQEQLVDRLIPHGVILFAESSEREPDPKGFSPADSWLGSWHVVLKPQYRTPDFRISQIEGTSPGAKEPEWRILYSPKKR